jgi:hypothetical protein
MQDITDVYGALTPEQVSAAEARVARAAVQTSLFCNLKALGPHRGKMSWDAVRFDDYACQERLSRLDVETLKRIRAAAQKTLEARSGHSRAFAAKVVAGLDALISPPEVTDEQLQWSMNRRAELIAQGLLPAEATAQAVKERNAINWEKGR